MARSPTVPHVPSSSVKVAVPSDVMERVDAVAERAGLTRDDCVELGLRALLDGEESPAAVVWSRYTRGQVQTPADVISALASANVPDSVRGFRLGAPAADRAPVPWPRNGPGADLNADPIAGLANRAWIVADETGRNLRSSSQFGWGTFSACIGCPAGSTSRNPDGITQSAAAQLTPGADWSTRKPVPMSAPLRLQIWPFTTR